MISPNSWNRPNFSVSFKVLSKPSKKKHLFGAHHLVKITLPLTSNTTTVFSICIFQQPVHLPSSMAKILPACGSPWKRPNSKSCRKAAWYITAGKWAEGTSQQIHQGVHPYNRYQVYKHWVDEFIPYHSTKNIGQSTRPNTTPLAVVGRYGHLRKYQVNKLPQISIQGRHLKTKDGWINGPRS